MWHVEFRYFDRVSGKTIRYLSIMADKTQKDAMNYAHTYMAENYGKGKGTVNWRKARVFKCRGSNHVECKSN